MQISPIFKLDKTWFWPLCFLEDHGLNMTGTARWAWFEWLSGNVRPFCGPGAGSVGQIDWLKQGLVNVPFWGFYTSPSIIYLLYLLFIIYIWITVSIARNTVKHLGPSKATTWDHTTVRRAKPREIQPVVPCFLQLPYHLASNSLALFLSRSLYLCCFVENSFDQYHML